MQLPRFRLTVRRMLVWVAIASIASHLALEPFPPRNPLVNFLVGATVSAAFGVGAARHPWMFLAIGICLWNWVPLIDHGEDARSLSVRGSFVAWAIGAPAGWYSRRRTAARMRETGPDHERDSTVGPL